MTVLAQGVAGSNPLLNITIFALFVRRHAGRGGPGEQAGHVGRIGLLHRRWRVQRPAERHCDLRRLPVRGFLPRHRHLHRPDRAGGASLGGLGDRADRAVLPVHPGARVRRRRAGRAGRDQESTGWGQLGRAAAGLRARRHATARGDRRSRLRHDPRRGRRPDHHRVGVVRPRHLRQRDQARQGRRATAGGQGRPDHGGRDRRGRHLGGILPTGRTSPSWWRSPSRSRRRPTCRRSSTPCSGRGSPPTARCGASTAVSA